MPPTKHPKRRANRQRSSSVRKLPTSKAWPRLSMVSRLHPNRRGGLRSLTFDQCLAKSCFARPRRECVTSEICESVMSTVCPSCRRLRLKNKADPSAAISSAQKGSTGQNPRITNINAKVNENKHVAAKNAVAVLGVSEQLGLSSMRCSIAKEYPTFEGGGRRKTLTT
jgi:hypothetical protein